MLGVCLFFCSSFICNMRPLSIRDAPSDWGYRGGGLSTGSDFQADYITVVEARPIMSVKYCLPATVFHFWPKL